MMRLARTLCGAAALTLATTAAYADVAFPSRTSSVMIATTKPDLSDASAKITATTQVAPGSTGTRELDFGASPRLSSFATTSQGSVSVDAAVVDRKPQYAEIAGTVTATGGGSFALLEGFDLDYDPYGAGPLFWYPDGRFYQDRANYGFLPAFTATDLPSLELFLPIGGAGLVDQDGEFIAEVFIPGDYSTTNGLDSGTGQHYLAHLNENWRITDNFVYDPGTNLTKFRAVNAKYDYDDPNPFGLELDVFFFGAPSAATAVPEPTSWASMVLGLLLLGAALRSRWAGRDRAAAPVRFAVSR